MGIRYIFFLISPQNILEAPHQGTSNEYPQHRFSCRNKKILLLFDCKKHLIKSYECLITKYIIGLDKGGYPINIFLISPRKHMLWRNKKNINTFELKKSALTSAMLHVTSHFSLEISPFLVGACHNL